MGWPLAIQEAADVTVGPNGRVVWVFPAPGLYRVKIHNLGPIMNHSTVTIRELGPGRQIEVPESGARIFGADTAETGTCRRR